MSDAAILTISSSCCLPPYLRLNPLALPEAQVVVATNMGSGSDDLEDHRFKLVVIDEAVQCQVQESLVPLAKGASHVVLVGDPK